MCARSLLLRQADGHHKPAKCTLLPGSVSEAVVDCSHQEVQVPMAAIGEGMVVETDRKVQMVEVVVVAVAEAGRREYRWPRDRPRR